MPNNDIRADFEKISDKAKAATDELKATGHRTRDQLETDVARVRDRATAAADGHAGSCRAERRGRALGFNMSIHY